MGLPPTATASVQVLTSAITLLPIYVVTGPLFVGPASAANVTALVLLGVLGSGVAYWLFHQVVAQAGSQVAAMVTYTNPVIATIWGIALLGEGLHWYEPVGALLVILGAYLTQSGRLRIGKS
jgi:drug/metabolite transporter (DMT)-like permease